MPTAFPSGLDNFTNPTPSDKLATPTVLHSDQHSNANDAIEALEAKVGVNGSSDPNSLDYKISAITPVTPAALTKTDDTNVTITLGGSPSTALLQGVSLTMGWSGALADDRITSAATWNAKQNALTNPVTGLLSLGRIPQASGSTSLTNSNLVGPASNLLTLEASSGSITLTVGGNSSINGAALVGTPGTLTVATTNNATDPHTHAIIASSSPAATSALLKTDANGSIIFDTSVLSVDAVNNRVGVGRADPQYVFHVSAPIQNATLASFVTTASDGDTILGMAGGTITGSVFCFDAYATASSTVYYRARNYSTNSASRAVGIFQTAVNGGDVAIDLLHGNNRWLIGIDASDSDKFKMGDAALFDPGWGTNWFTLDRSGNLGLNIESPAVRIHAVLSDAVTNTVTEMHRMAHNSSGTPAAGFGVSQTHYLGSSTTANQLASQIATVWSDATHATRTSNIDIYSVSSGALIKTITLGGGTYMTVCGSLATPVVSTSSDLVLSALHHRILVTTSATITLPTAIGITGREYSIKAAAGVMVSIVTTLSQTIDGNANMTISDNQNIVLFSDGANWRIG